jgi:hypothetical protein
MSALLRPRRSCPPIEVALLVAVWAVCGVAVVEAVAHTLGRPATMPPGLAPQGLRFDLLALGDVALAVVLSLSLRPSPAAVRARELWPRVPLTVHLPWLWVPGLLLGAVAVRWVLLAIGAPAGQASAALGLGAVDLGRTLIVGALTCGLLSCGRVVFLALGTLWCVARLTPLAVLDPWHLSASAGWALWSAWGATATAGLVVGARLGPQLRRLGAASAQGRGGTAARGAVDLWAGALLVAASALALRSEPRARPIEIPRQAVVVHTALGAFERDELRPQAAAELLSHASAISSALSVALPPSGESAPTPPSPVDARALRAGPFGLGLAQASRRVQAALGAHAEDRATRSLRDGLALRLALKATGTDPFWARYRVAVAHARGELVADHLWDSADLEADLGLELAGPLGEVACAGLERLKPGAARKLLARWVQLPPLPTRDRMGCRARWRYALQALGLELEQVWEAAMQEVLAIRDDPRAAFPLPRVRLVLELQNQPLGWQVMAQPDAPIPPGWRVVCRARERQGDRWEALPTRARGYSLEGLPNFYVPASNLSSSPWIQLGLAHPQEPLLHDGLWEPWTPPILARQR